MENFDFEAFLQAILEFLRNLFDALAVWQKPKKPWPDLSLPECDCDDCDGTCDCC